MISLVKYDLDMSFGWGGGEVERWGDGEAVRIEGIRHRGELGQKACRVGSAHQT
jgi:hypothetical protein